MIRIALLGCGRIGKMHADNINAHPNAELAGVYDLHRSVAEEVSEKNNTKLFSEAKEVFASNEIDAVLIATPTSTHIEYIEMAVNANKAILCEKPIALSVQRVNELKKKIEGTSVPIMLGFVRRFDPGHAAAKKAMLDGEIGELHQVIITSRDPGMAPDNYIKTSGGIFRDMTIHDLDLARFMLDDKVVSVSACGSQLVNPGLMKSCNDFDTVVVTLETENGKQAVITNSRQAVYGYDQRVELFGSKGMVISGNHNENQVTRFSDRATNVSAPLQHFFIERYTDAFNAEIDLFTAAVEQGSEVPVGFEDGRLALVLADACLKSVYEARTVQVHEVEETGFDNVSIMLK